LLNRKYEEQLFNFEFLSEKGIVSAFQMPPQSGAGSVNIWNNREKEKEAGLAAASF